MFIKIYVYKKCVFFNTDILENFSPFQYLFFSMLLQLFTV
jgi:hypothetical protein